MKIVSFNINSVRARVHQLEAVVKTHAPDIVCLQETKVSDADFPHSELEHLGYHIEIHGQKGHYGVATLSKEAPVSTQKGFSSDDADAQRRALITQHSFNNTVITVFNGYFPQGESRDHPTKFPAKEKFYQDLTDFLISQQQQPTIVLGDFNISHTDLDIGIGEPNRKRWLRTGKCSFLPEEREWLNRIVDLGFEDTFRKIYPTTNDRFSWFDYRSKGFQDDPKRGLRIDLILSTPQLSETVSDVGIDYDIRSMDKPSDHCPIWCEFKL